MILVNWNIEIKISSNLKVDPFSVQKNACKDGIQSWILPNLLENKQELKKILTNIEYS